MLRAVCKAVRCLAFLTASRRALPPHCQAFLTRYLFLYPLQAARLEGHYKAVRSLCFSPDGSMVLTACDDGHAHLYDAHHGALIDSFSGGWSGNALRMYGLMF